MSLGDDGCQNTMLMRRIYIKIKNAKVALKRTWINDVNLRQTDTITV